MNEEQRLLFAIAATYLRRKRKRRSVWIHETIRARGHDGEYHRLVQELRLDEVRFQQYFRLDRTQFDVLLRRVGPLIAKENTNYRRAISPGERLAICLRFLATGDFYRTIASYRVGHSSVAGILAEVAKAIWDSLVEDYMPVPTTEDCREIAAEFYHRWNFPSCLGSIDSSGSLFYNYKRTFSIVLLAVVDAKYCFRIIDVGSYGKTSDGGTLANSPFGNALRRVTLGLPEDTLLPGAEHLGPQPYVFVADEAFPLRRDLMRPSPGTTLPSRHMVFNNRLSQARLTVENAFGILAAQWRMYRRVIGISPSNAETCVKATCVLHNFLRRTTRTVSYVGDGEASGLHDISQVGSNNAAREAMRVRETLVNYFSAEGAVPWQPQA
ncbi:hypothetical protein R3I93_006702 [Phoxinus phoxinus]|uniref:DDE Tnp4 domain-containing protein n=1 Tax=Phoxinus phoxinus TaxID=58324 RepID=A0AAN9D7B2_9TELE